MSGAVFRLIKYFSFKYSKMTDLLAQGVNFEILFALLGVICLLFNMFAEQLIIPIIIIISYSYNALMHFIYFTAIWLLLPLLYFQLLMLSLHFIYFTAVMLSFAFYLFYSCFVFIVFITFIAVMTSFHLLILQL